jgi:hypothetical protein
MVDASFSCTRRVTYDVRKFHATMVYSYTLPTIMGPYRELLGLLDGLGINLNPAIIWNAIPWSFVVDWFIGISRWLNQFQVRNIEPVVQIHGFCYSLHAKRVVQTTVSSTAYAGQVMAISEEAYERNVGLDQAAITSAFRTSGLNPKEFSLSAALALSR